MARLTQPVSFLGGEHTCLEPLQSRCLGVPLSGWCHGTWFVGAWPCAQDMRPQLSNLMLH